MIDLTKTQAALYQRVGWRQPTQTDYDILSAANLVTNSGLIFQDFNPLVTVENLHNCQVDKDVSDVNFNTWLVNFQKAAINKIVNACVNREDLIENAALFPFENVKTDKLDNNGDFVGYEIELAKRKDIAVVLNQIITEFDADEAITIYLFHSSQQTALTTYSITTSANNAKFTTAGTVLYFENLASQYVGGKFYLGYLTTGMTAKALNRTWNSSNVRNKFTDFSIKPIKVPGHTDSTLFDVDDVSYESDTYGINLDISTYQEYSDIVTQNKILFDRAIGLQVACDTLAQIILSARTNRIKREVGDAAFNELNGAYTGEGIPLSVGLLKQLNKEIERITKILFPKNNLKTYTLK